MKRHLLLPWISVPIHGCDVLSMDLLDNLWVTMQHIHVSFHVLVQSNNLITTTMHVVLFLNHGQYAPPRTENARES